MQTIQLIRRLPLLALALTACTTTTGGGSSAPRQNASKAFSAANSRMEIALAAANGSRLAPVNGSFSLSSPCSLGGSLDLAGTFDNTAAITFDLDASFAACQEDEGTLDGALHGMQTVAGETVHDAWSGTLDFTDAQGSWTCAFDYSSTVDTTGVHYAGSICGYDVNADLGLSD